MSAPHAAKQRAFARRAPVKRHGVRALLHAAELDERELLFLVNVHVHHAVSGADHAANLLQARRERGSRLASTAVASHRVHRLVEKHRQRLLFDRGRQAAKVDAARVACSLLRQRRRRHSRAEVHAWHAHRIDARHAREGTLQLRQRHGRCNLARRAQVEARFALAPRCCATITGPTARAARAALPRPAA